VRERETQAGAVIIPFMETQVLVVDPQHPEPERIARAAEILRGGGLVAFPTETVYGLGANALDRAAIGRVFAAKGRPANNPIIVHVPDAAAALSLVADWPLAAERLAARFWPGPLTLVLFKSEKVPGEVTAGGPTVAVRVPAHPVALALLKAADIPLAAPSANRSSRLSPTRATHVLRDLAGRIDLLLDGGPTAGGLESTVLDLTSMPPRLLRPGLVSVRDIEAVIGPILHAQGPLVADQPLRSPGQLPRHYAPRASLECVPTDEAERRVQELRRAGQRVGWVRLSEKPAKTADAELVVVLPAQAPGYAAGLYDALHALDDAGVDRIVVELPPNGEEWLAIHDRLRRASAGK
jgi:L-threonylcarbamoyladenylate synthase